MNYTKDELIKYEEYLNFVRRKMIDDLDLEVNNIMDINIQNIMPYIELDLRNGCSYKDKSEWHFTCFNEHHKRKDRMGWGFSYDAISYDVWTRMVLQEDRNRKINQLGL